MSAVGLWPAMISDDRQIRKPPYVCHVTRPNCYHHMSLQITNWNNAQKPLSVHDYVTIHVFYHNDEMTHIRLEMGFYDNNQAKFYD